MAKKEDVIEKAVSRKVGDAHPNGKWIWTEYKPGKFDWRPIKNSKQSNGSSSGGDDGTKKTPSKPSSSQIAGAKAKAGKPMNSQQLIDWAQKTSDDNLLKVANSKNSDAQMRKIAYDALEQRGFDMTQVDTSGTLSQLMKMTGKTGAAKTTSSDDSEDDVASAADDSDVDIDDDSDGGTDGNKITEKWYLDRNDDRVKKMFNLKTKEGRIKYDQFVYKMKKKEKDYKNPIEVVQDLNEQYLEFLDNNEQRFMISAGGAGIGKSYGFNKLAELLNMKPFEEGDSPGDGDYDIFEAPDVNSGKQLLNILKAHNGKIILFDDNDKVLKRADCASVMKKATATTGRRVVGDPDDVKQNFEFTGRIIIMTNKDLAQLAESEDTKAIISRAMMVSEIYMTVPETIEVMESRYQWENNAIKRKNAFSNAYNYPLKRFQDWMMKEHYGVINKKISKELEQIGDKVTNLQSDIKVTKSELNIKTSEMSDLKKTKDPNGDIISGIYEFVRIGNKQAIGTYAALKGYDAIIEPHGNGGPNSFMIILNRSKVIVKK